MQVMLDFISYIFSFSFSQFSKKINRSTRQIGQVVEIQRMRFLGSCSQLV